MEEQRKLKPLNSELLEVLKNIPKVSGVYHYYDEFGRLLYVGKAKNLKNRIKSYFRFTPALAPAPNLSLRITQMISQVCALRYLVVENEHDALILENSLIKQLKPKYNILLRDDKTYPYLCVDFNEDFPRIVLTRKVFKKAKGLQYFGPFSVGCRDLMDSLYELYPLVQKESCKRGNKACLFYQIKRCLAPCEGKVDKEKYAKILKEALKSLENPKKIITQLEEKMLNLSSQMRFEEAIVLRDRIAKIKSINPLSSVDFVNLGDLDVFAFVDEGKRGAIVKFFVRSGKIVSSSVNIIQSNFGFEKDEVYAKSVLNYYHKDLPIVPKEILLSDCIDEDKIVELEAHLKILFDKKISLHTPKNGEKRKLCELALENAKEVLRLNVNKEKDVIEALAELFCLDESPYRIEVFDTSHHKGEECVGAMVVYENGWDKESYRHYHLNGSDEYSQMKEMLMRRIEDFSKDSPPNLWLLDGGLGQINLAKSLLESAGVNLKVLGIAKEKLDFKAHRAKGSAKDILRDGKAEFSLKPSDKRLQFLQKLRDEAHRFAITLHQKQKQKTMQKSRLLEIKGISYATQKKLLAYFGSFEAVQKASLEELCKIVPFKIAQEIKRQDK
ncbi:excinuclease ABC subunit UvrC [Helicobacter burdigaliensis]|uniref:excinuclease ABC subunit UvrC n=1 Tax=Helicobacter burdigaliensis TaxID=2315334 RepID=UPI000EF6532D|nr:excinuclease ABC subunit UvrC [Helicobacter burdigaliensis]